ncbi:hypothetical protein [Streptomyces silvisoli]|uniref:hypothetical protein n=1 Tax=Streptomyces silvisoli TaxID=3034235 RepID=UPI0037037970
MSLGVTGNSKCKELERVAGGELDPGLIPSLLALLCPVWMNASISGHYGVPRRPSKSLIEVTTSQAFGATMLLKFEGPDYETLPASSEAMIHIASIDNLTQRITVQTAPTWQGAY